MTKKFNFNQQYPLPQGKFYTQWRAGRSSFVTGILACVFMAGGIMVNLMLLGMPFLAYALALVTFGLTAMVFIMDQKAIGIRPVTQKDQDSFVTNPSANSDQDNNRNSVTTNKAA